MACLLVVAPPRLAAAPPTVGKAVCGTSHSAQETLFLHEQRSLRRPGLEPMRQSAPTSFTEVDDLVILEAGPNLVSPPNLFDLHQMRVAISPGDTAVRIESLADNARTPIADEGVALDLEDDDFSLIELPFTFPFYGEEYTHVFVQSDGNLTFVWPEASSTARNYSRIVGGPPSIAPFFRDLDPSRGGNVRVQVLGNRLVVTWFRVPVFVDEGVGSPQTFQVALEETGAIEFRYGPIDATDAVVGTFPGDPSRSARAVDWSGAESESFNKAAILAEVFRDERTLDEWAVVHAFLGAYDDTYDSLVVFNDFDFDASPYSLAHAYTIRNEVEGIGEFRFDYGRFFGSPERLSAFVNMGAVSEYPPNPLDPIPGLPHSSLLTVLAHEIGHRFLAYPVFLDPETGEKSFDLLGRQFAHWSFFFNSDASVLEGNSIRDHGAEASPRFETIAATQTYSALDQYLMGLRDPSEVPATFLVKDPSASGRLGTRGRSPEVGVRFDGIRKEIHVQDIINAQGERRPDATMAQRHFRQAFVLLVEAGSTPQPETIDLLKRLRSLWLMYFRAQFGSRASTAADLVRMLHLSTWPAGGLIENSSGRARVTIADPRETDLIVRLTLEEPIASAPATVTIPAGGLHAEFEMSGLSAGATTMTAATSEPGYDRSVARLSVKDGMSGLSLERLQWAEVYGVAGSPVPHLLRFRVLDENRVPYSGVEVEYVATGDDPASIPDSVTDSDGLVAVNWPLAASPDRQLLTVRLKRAPEVVSLTTARAAIGSPTFETSGVMNAASHEVACPPAAPVERETQEEGVGSLRTPCTGRGFAPGSLVTIRGSGLAARAESADTLLVFGNLRLPDSLAGTRVHVGGVAAPLTRVSPSEVTFQVPFQVQEPTMPVLVTTPYGRSETVMLPVSAAQPGIFPGRVSGGARAAVIGTKPGSGLLPRAGGILELFCTGLGAVDPPGRAGRPGTSHPLQRVVGETEAWVDDQPVRVQFSLLATFEAGVYVVVLDLPDYLRCGRAYGQDRSRRPREQRSAVRVRVKAPRVLTGPLDS